MKPVSDPNLLQQLEGMKPVQDPAVLAQLEGPTDAQREMVSPVNRAAKGAMDPFTGMAQMLYNALPESVQKAGTQADKWLYENTGGFLGADRPFNQKVADEEKAYQEARQATGQSGIDGPRLAGNIASSTALMAMGPKVGSPSLGAQVAESGAYGAGLGMTQPVTDPESNFWEEKGRQGATGGVFGLAGGLIAPGISRVIRPKPSKEVQTLMKEGVTPSPGQILGGAAKGTEEKLRSLPIMGDLIRSSQNRSIAELNRAAYNRALAPIGKSAKGFPIGREGVDRVKQELSNAYDELLPKLTFQADDQFAGEFGKISEMVKALPEGAQRRFQRIIQDQFGKMTPSGRMSGETYQAIRGQLKKEADKLRKDPSVDMQDLSDALNEIRRSMHNVLYRSNPKEAARLAQIDKGYANYAVIRQAGQMQGAEGGFTPAQLSMAVKASDKSVGRGNTATGKALMQDLSDAGRTVLAQSVPNSGTADRALLAAGAVGTGAINPAIPAALTVGSVPYAPGVRDLVAALMTKRPGVAGPVADVVRRSGPVLTVPYALSQDK